MGAHRPSRSASAARAEGRRRRRRRDGWSRHRGHRHAAPEGPQRRYSPAEFISQTIGTVTGNPDRKHVGTSYAERQNLSMRMGMRRFTRLTNAFSKKAENHAHAIAIYFMRYNFVPIHQSLRVTPAMAAKVTDRLWDVADMVKVFEDWEAAKQR
jgi:hypothetical protein